MKAPYKLLWLYILDECDHAGIWQVDLDVAQLKIGEKLNAEDALKFFGDKVISFSNGEKWFVFDFIDFQYGLLNPQNRVHYSVILLLQKYGLMDLDYNFIIENKPLTSPLQGAKDKDKDKGKVMDKEKDKENGKLFTDMVSVYDSFIKEKTGVGCRMDAVEGASLKKIIIFLQTELKDKDKTDEAIIAAFQWVLSNFDKWDKFHQGQIKLAQINSNLINLINSIKNGKSTTKNPNAHAEQRERLANYYSKPTD